MAEFRKISAYVAWLDEKENSKVLEVLDRNNLMKRYQEATGLSRREVSRIHGAAEKHGYIENAGIYFQFSVNPEKGYNLIQRRWRMPTGVMRATFEENKTLIATTTAIVIAICTVVNLLIAVR